MKTQMMHVENVPGRVLVGPKKLRNAYVRIVSQRDGSGRIERYDLGSGNWSPAPESITFSEVWSAPPVSAMAWAGLDPKP
jgi:hypothetical protein